jgi:hypothetical protein
MFHMILISLIVYIDNIHDGDNNMARGALTLSS